MLQVYEKSRIMVWPFDKVFIDILGPQIAPTSYTNQNILYILNSYEEYFYRQIQKIITFIFYLYI